MAVRVRRGLRGAAAVAVVVVAGGLPGQTRLSSGTAGVTAFVGVSVVPMDRETVLPDQTVIVEGDRIVAVGPTGSIGLPAGAVRIDAAGRYLMPGLVDMHVHIREHELFAYVANGITSVRNMWGYTALPEIMRQIESGAVVGPTIYSASPGLDGPPGYWPQTQVIDDPARADALVAAQVAAGWLFIKVYQNLSLGVYDAIMTAARARGIRVVGHVPTDVPVEHALEAGQVSLEHLHGYDLALTRRNRGPFDPVTWTDIDASKLPDLAERTRLAGAWNCPTLAIWEIFTRGMAPADRQLVLSNRRLVVGALHAATRRILAGTDSGIDQTAAGTSIHDELADLVASGLSPYEALWGATSGAAQFLERTGEIGSITPGRRADLLLLDRNPLEDAGAARNPRGVMWHGLWRVDPGMTRVVISPCSAGAPADCRRRHTRTVVH